MIGWLCFYQAMVRQSIMAGRIGRSKIGGQEADGKRRRGQGQDTASKKMPPVTLLLQLDPTF
jgi:hypothetical protein